MASTVENRADGEAPVELAAPEGWKKTFALKKSGTPRRNAIVFISPTGEEIKSKRQLDQYLKSHPGGPASSEFDWSTGETPRRSRRLSEKSKAMQSPESEPPQKRQNKSSSEKVEDDADGENEAVEEKDDVREETKTSEDVDMKEVEDERGVSKEASVEHAVTAVSDDKDAKTDPKTKGKDVKGDEVNVGTAEDPGTDNKTTDEKDKQVANNLTAELVANKEEAEKQKEPEVPLELENEKAGEKIVFNSGENFESVSLPRQDLDDGKEGAEKQPGEAEAPSREPVHNERASLEKDGHLKESEDGSRSPTTYSMHHEDKTTHEPKASQVSC